MHRVERIGRILLLLVIICSLTGCGAPGPNFDRPIILAKNPDETKLFIFDSRNRRVIITDRNFKLINQFTHPYFENVWGMCVSKKDEIVVTNNRDTKVTFSAAEKKENSVAEAMFFDMSGNLLDQFTWKGEKGKMVFPSQIISQKDNFLIGDLRLNKILRMNRKGEIIGEFGSYGEGPGQLYYPNDVQETPDGNIIVSDCYNHRLQLFDKDGNFLKVIGEKGTGDGQIMFPQFSTTDKAGNIYCSDYYGMRVAEFDKDGVFKKNFFPSPSDAKFETYELYGIVHLSNPDQLYVVDSINSRIHVITPDGKTVQSVTGFIK